MKLWAPKRFVWPLSSPPGLRWLPLADFFCELSDQVELLLPLVVVKRHRRDDQRVDSRVAKRTDALLRPLRRSGDADGVDQVVRQREHRLALATGKVELLHLLGLALESV